MRGYVQFNKYTHTHTHTRMTGTDCAVIMCNVINTHTTHKREQGKIKLIFPVQLTTGRIGNLTRLIHTLAICDDHTSMHNVWKYSMHFYINNAKCRTIDRVSKVVSSWQKV